MPQKAPFSGRPNLHLSTLPSGSPQYLDPGTTSSSSLATPLATTAYSPFRSAGLKPPTPYGGPMHFTPRRPPRSDYMRFYRWIVTRVIMKKALWIMLLLMVSFLWWIRGGRQELGNVKVSANGIRRELFGGLEMQGLQFFPANNPKIHYIGRWTATPNRLRKDGTFPGVYFDITIQNTTTLLLSLYNAKTHDSNGPTGTMSSAPSPTPHSELGHFSFRPVPQKETSAPPISLLARVDQEEYVLLPNSSMLVSISSNNLDRYAEHQVRIVAPMTDDHGKGVIQLEGIWLSTGAKLVPVKGSLLSEEYENEDSLSSGNDQVGEKHRIGLSGILRDKSRSKTDQTIIDDIEDDALSILQDRNKVLEVVTDSPGWLSSRNRGKRKGGTDGLMAGVMGWEYLLGEMYAVDHVRTGVDGMCLTQDCIGGIDQPSGIGDVFFRSGPHGSAYFEHPWAFSGYIPDVLVFNLGASDFASFGAHESEYTEPKSDLLERFEATYVSLIKAIRALAYPKHPVTVLSERPIYSDFALSTAPASIPIFIMRPFHGQLEESTQRVVNKLRADGDKSVFWLDTSGWLDLEDKDLVTRDFFLDENTSPTKWRLTEKGNQRVAIFLHLHVCQYLAATRESCAFLPPEVYQGKLFDPDEAVLDRFLEDEKERKLKKLFLGSQE